MTFRSCDLVWIFAVGAVLHFNLASGILYQNYGVLPQAQLPVTVWDPVVNGPVLSGYDNNLVTTNDLSKLNGFGTSYYHPQTIATVYGTVKTPSDADDGLYGYYHNGRFLKQYFVAEENVDDINALNSFLSRFMPFVPASYNALPASKLPNLGFPTITPQPSPAPIDNNPLNNFYRIAPVQPVQPVPVQLGSGSLGYVRLPNGAVYLGSGSLGYTNDRETKFEVRSRQSPQASATTFGEAPQ